VLGHYKDVQFKNILLLTKLVYIQTIHTQKLRPFIRTHAIAIDADLEKGFLHVGWQEKLNTLLDFLVETHQ